MESHRLTPFDLYLPQNELIQPLSQRLKTRQLTLIEWRREESFTEKPKRPRLLKKAIAHASESTALKPIKQGTLPSLVTMPFFYLRTGFRVKIIFASTGIKRGTGGCQEAERRSEIAIKHR